MLSVTATCKIDDKTAYLAEVQQAGIFGLAGFDAPGRDAVLGDVLPERAVPVRAPGRFAIWSRMAASRRSSCSRSISTRCTPTSSAAAPKAAARAPARTPDAERCAAMSDTRRRSRFSAPAPGARRSRRCSRATACRPRCGVARRKRSSTWRPRGATRAICPISTLPDSLQLSGATRADRARCRHRADRGAEPRVRRAARRARAVDRAATPASRGRPRASIRHPGRFLHELVAERLPGHAAAVVTGPSFAREVALGPADRGHRAFGRCRVRASASRDMLHSPLFRAYTGNDVLGAELGGAMKNVLAVATGVADGMQLGLNARAGLITRGLDEMLRLGAALGARAGNADGPGRPRRSGADLHRRSVAQPPPRPRARPRRAAARRRSPRSVRSSKACRRSTR